jgi:DNA invertase Pin-like site-specific DNA recombinase
MARRDTDTVTKPAAKTNKIKAYSYTRFSTPEQAKGDSARRQIDAAEDYARKHDLDLDTSLTFKDLGVSAYRGRNVEEGRLGDFRRAVEAGVVAPGSYLLVENLDRISRQSALKALRILQDIVEAGVTVVTLSDGKAYTEANLHNDLTSLMIALLTFVRAHEESMLKGRRLRAAWENKRKQAVESGIPLTRRTPSWLVLGADRKLRLDRKKAAIVRRMFNMTLKGVGQHAIAETFNREQVKTLNGAAYWHRSTVKKTLENPAAVGRLVAHRVEYEGGRKVRKPVLEVDKHFPAVVPGETWQQVQDMRGRASRPAPKGPSALQNMLAGLARCPLCEGAMTRVTKGRTAKAGSPYLVCAKAKAGAGCQYQAVRMEIVDAVVQAQWPIILGTIPGGDGGMYRKLEKLEQDAAAARDQAEMVTEAIAQRGMTGALGNRLQIVEETIRWLEETIAKVRVTPLLQIKIDELQKEVEKAKPNRQRVNALLRQLADAVVVDYAKGLLVFQWKLGGETFLPLDPSATPLPGNGRLLIGDKVVGPRP